MHIAHTVQGNSSPKECCPLCCVAPRSTTTTTPTCLALGSAPGGLRVAPSQSPLPRQLIAQMRQDLVSPLTTATPDRLRSNMSSLLHAQPSKHVLAAVILLAGACTPGTPSAQTTPGVAAPTKAVGDPERARAETSNPVEAEANAELSANGSLRVAVGGASVSGDRCSAVAISVAISKCKGDTHVRLARGTKHYSILLASLYIDRDATLCRGRLDAAHECNSHSFILSDVTQDGHEDFIAWTGKDGAYGGPSYDVLLYDHKTDDFVGSPLFSELTVGANGLFSTDGDHLITTSSDGCCTLVVDTYSLENGEPKLLERVTQEREPATSQPPPGMRPAHASSSTPGHASRPAIPH